MKGTVLMGAFDQKLDDFGSPAMIGFVLAPARVALPSVVRKTYDPYCEPLEETEFWKQLFRLVPNSSSTCFMRSYISTLPPPHGSMTLNLEPTATYVVSFHKNDFIRHPIGARKSVSVPPEGIVGSVHTLRWEDNAVWGWSNEQWEPSGVEIFCERDHTVQFQFYGNMCPDQCLPLRFSGFSFVC